MFHRKPAQCAPSATIRPIGLVLLILLTVLPGCRTDSRSEEIRNVIRLKGATFLPEEGIEPELRRVLQRERNERIHFLIQFHQVPDLKLRRELDSQLGLTILDTVPERAFFASMPTKLETAERLLERSDVVRWMGLIPLEAKVAPWLRQEIPGYARRGDDAEVIVQFFNDVESQRQEEILLEAGAEILTHIVPLEGWRVLLQPSALAKLAELDAVKWIEEIPPPPEDDNDDARAPSSTNADAVLPPSGFGLTGAGVTVAQWESTHASSGHGDFAGRYVLGDPPVPANERNVLHDESVVANVQFDVGESAYRDEDDSLTVSVGDTRLTAAGVFAAGSVVAGADADVGTPLVFLAALERYADTVTVDGAFSPTEVLYLDNDGIATSFTGTVSAGDMRLTGPSAGVAVLAGDPDTGQLIRRTSINPHYHATHVAGTIMGSGAQSLAFGGSANQWQGIAPGAVLRSYSDLPVSATGAPVPGDEYTDAATAGAALSSNSWGYTHCHDVFPPATCYDTASQYYDTVISGRKSDGTASGLPRQILIFGSAGNNGRPVRHDESVAVNGVYDNGEGIYYDSNDSGTVSTGNTRLSAVGVFAAGTAVGAADADNGNALINFNLNEVHDDTVSTNVFPDLDTRWTYDAGEGIYLDVDGSMTVSAGDTRITAVGAFPAGSVVAGGDADDGVGTRRFNLWMNVRVPNSAKDAIEVANIASDDKSLSASSSRGPTDDGRLKPDIAGPGHQNSIDFGLTSAFPGNAYLSLTGTSMSTPALAGSAALLEEWHQSACAAAGAAPAVLKALLLHTAEDLTNIPNVGAAYSGPDFAFGYGRSDVERAVSLLPHHLTGNAAVLGDTDVNVTVANMSTLKVTLVWDDPAWTAAALPSAITGILQNDLDLVLIAPDGTQYTPWENLAANPFAVANRTVTPALGVIPASARDRRNPVEQVVVDNAAAGTWTIRVTASTLNQPTQNYVLVSEALPVDSGPCATIPAADVWLMDNPTDTGAVPSAGSMWLGPDPWNRLIDDGVNSHQDPEFGQPNYLYATLRNATAVDVSTTSLDFYVASAAVGLVWPDNFDHVGRLTVPNMGPSEVRQVGPLEWLPPSPLPSDHHCMYVRVQSPQDPITFAEVPSILTNAQQSNNLVYRNLTVVDLASSVTKTFLVRNTDRKPAEIDLVIRVDEKFLDRGRVMLHLLPGLEKLWPEERRSVSGLEKPAPGLQVVLDPLRRSRMTDLGGHDRPELEAFEKAKWLAEGNYPRPAPYRIRGSEVVFKGLRFGPRQAVPLRLTFFSDAREKAQYRVDVIQKVEGEVRGGIRFLVRTGHKEGDG